MLKLVAFGIECSFPKVKPEDDTSYLWIQLIKTALTGIGKASVDIKHII